MIAYHWTTIENASRILRDGLRAWSFVCRKPSDWRGEICLQIELLYEFEWEERDEDARWQAIVQREVNPSKIRIGLLHVRQTGS